MKLHPAASEPPEAEPHTSRDQSGIELKRPSSPLLAHLGTLSDDPEVQEAIELLQDIRRFQHHPELERLFEQDQVDIALQVRDYSQDILALMVRDYMAEHGVRQADERSRSQGIELEMHIKFNILSRLEEYQLTIANIREKFVSCSDSNLPDEPLPFSSRIPETRGDLLRKMEYPKFGSPADTLKQVIKAFEAGEKGQSGLSDAIHNNAELQAVVEQLKSSGDSFSRTLVDQYLAQKQRGVLPFTTFDDYLNSLLSAIEQTCDPQTFRQLVEWRPRLTIPVLVAPPTSPVQIYDEKALTPENKPYVYQERSFIVRRGRLSEIVYAMPGAFIEVEDGAKLDLLMVGDKVTIKLKGVHSHLHIKKAGRRCTGFTILGPQGESLKEGANIELGNGVAEKLKT